MITRFYNGQVLRNHAFTQEEFWVKDGVIIAPATKADHEVNAEGMWLAPGYIDLQVNGGFGYDFVSSEECLSQVAKGLTKYGVTAFLPTLTTSYRDLYPQRLPQLQPKKGGLEGAHCLGIHLEGPFLNPKEKGAHREDLMEVPRNWDPEAFYGSLEGVKLFTIAPELPGALRMIKQLKKQGITIAIGHSDASYDEMLQAIDAGATIVTHLFNAVSPIHHRAPGVIGAALTLPELYVTLICDGIHLHKAIIDLTHRCKPNRIILITDAISALGLPPGVYHLGLELVEVDQKKAYLPHSKQLAGAIGSMDSAVRYFKACTGCSSVEALEAASLRPAEALGIEKQKGNLNIGSDADFLLLDEGLHVRHCYVSGLLQQDKI